MEKAKIYIWIRLGLCLCGIAFSISSSGQEKITAHEFIRMGAFQDQEMKQIAEDKVDFPWIEEYELRTRTRDFDFDEQLYIFRVSPSTPMKRRAQQALYEHYKQAPDFDKIEIICDQLIRLHEDWLELYINEENTQLLLALNIVLMDKETVLEKMAGSYDFEFNKLINLQKDKSDISVALHELSLERQFILNKYGLADRELDFGDFLTDEDILVKLSTLVPESVRSEDPESIYKKELMAKELDLEMAENKQLFDYAQLRYDGPHDDLFRQRVSLGIGLSLSRSGNRKLKIQELQIKKAELARDETRKVEADHKKRTDMIDQLRMQVLSYEHFISTMSAERQALSDLGKQMTKAAGYSPLLLMDIEERRINNQLEALEKKENILDDYIDYMKVSGIICQDEIRNHLVRR